MAQQAWPSAHAQEESHRDANDRHVLAMKETDGEILAMDHCQSISSEDEQADGVPAEGADKR